MNAELKRLHDLRAATVTTYKSKLEEVRGKSITEDQKAELDRMLTDIDGYKAQIDHEERAMALDAEMAEVNERAAVKTGMSAEERAIKREVAFRNIMLGIATPEESKEFRVNSKLSGGAGAYSVPTEFLNDLQIALKYYNAFENDPRRPGTPLYTLLTTMEGRDIQIPLTNDTSNGIYLIAEGNDMSSGNDVTFTQKTLKAFKYSTKITQVSRELIEDSALNLNQLMAELFAERMGRGLNALMTTGAGTTTIQGVVTGSAQGERSATIAIDRESILDLIHSVDIAYRANGTLMMNDTTLKAIRKLDYGTADARPLYQASAILGMPDTIEGYPFVINNDMASPAARAKTILFGDFKKYWVRKVNDMRLVVLNELYAANDLVGYNMIFRVDGQLMDAGTNPIKHLVCPLT